MVGTATTGMADTVEPSLAVGRTEELGTETVVQTDRRSRGMLVVVAAQMGLGLEGFVITDTPGLFSDLGDEHQHSVGDGEGGLI